MKRVPPGTIPSRDEIEARKRAGAGADHLDLGPAAILVQRRRLDDAERAIVRLGELGVDDAALAPLWQWLEVQRNRVRVCGR